MRYRPTDRELFHVHTYRCGHAGDTRDHEYVDKAIALGAKRIVFTDHVPIPGDPIGYRMPMDVLPEYLQAISELKVRYAEQIEILCGLEIEFLPSLIDYYRDLKSRPEMDLLIIGQHFYEHPDGTLSYFDTDKTYEFRGQCEAMALGVETGLFDVVAHPDRSFRASAVLGPEERKAAELILSAIAKKPASERPYLEKNYSSMQNPKFFKKDFWEMVPKEYGIVYGIDAHSLEDLENGWNYRANV